jgi:hypothetical protein
MIFVKFSFVAIVHCPTPPTQNSGFKTTYLHHNKSIGKVLTLDQISILCCDLGSHRIQRDSNLCIELFVVLGTIYTQKNQFWSLFAPNELVYLSQTKFISGRLYLSTRDDFKISFIQL